MIIIDVFTIHMRKGIFAFINDNYDSPTADRGYSEPNGSRNRLPKEQTR